MFFCIMENLVLSFNSVTIKQDLLDGIKEESDMDKIKLMSTASSSSSSSLTCSELRKRRSLYSPWTRECRRRGIFCDTEIFAGPPTPNQPPIRAHRLILAVSCQYFRQQFMDPTTLKNDDGKIYIQNVSRAALEIMIDYMYAGQLDYIIKKVTPQNVLDLLIGAVVIGLDEVATLCQTRLMTTSMICTENWGQMMSYACHVGCSTVLENSVHFLLENLSIILDKCQEDFCRLSHDMIQLVIKWGRTIQYSPAVIPDLVYGVSMWIKYRAEERKIFMMDLLKNFPLKDYLAILHKIFVQEMDEEFKPIFYTPMTQYLLTSFVNAESPSETSSTSSKNDSMTTTSFISSGLSLDDYFPGISSTFPSSGETSSPESKSGDSSRKKSRKLSPHHEDDQGAPDPRIKKMKFEKYLRSSPNHYHDNDDEDELSTILISPDHTEDSKEIDSSLNVSTTSLSCSQPTDFNGTIYFRAIHLQDNKYEELWSYNLDTGKYETVGPINSSWPINSTLVCHEECILSLGGKRVAAGGNLMTVNSASVRIFDLKKKSWRDTDDIPDMRRNRLFFPALVMNGHLYVVGGCRRLGWDNDGKHLLLTCAERIQLFHNNQSTTGKWCEVEPLSGNRCDFGLATLMGKIYAVGGCFPPNKPTSDRHNFTTAQVDVYDPEGNVWTPVTPLGQARYGVCVVATDKFLYAMGGSCLSEPRLTCVERYCPVRNRWQTITPMVKGRRFARAVYWRAKNAIYIFGGDGQKPLSMKGRCTIEKLDLVTKKWEFVTHLKGEGIYTSMTFK